MVRQRTTKSGFMKRYKAATKTKPTPAFKKKVMTVVNSAAERKVWNKESSAYNLTLNVINTWNLLNGMAQGTGQYQRIGDKVRLGNLRLSGTYQNVTSNGLTVSTNGGVLRVIVFRGKYDYSSTNYPIADVLEGNGGSVPTADLATAPIDTNQVTVLYDKLLHMPPASYSNQCIKRAFVDNIKLNSNFYFRDDDSYGKTSNLYLGYIWSPAVTTDTATISFSARTTYTDL